MLAILAYHSISDKPYVYATRPADFAKQMGWLKKKFRVIGLKELETYLKAGGSFREDLIVITLDDGFDDLYLNAHPVLEKLGLPSAIFLATGYVNRDVTASDGTVLHYLNEGQIKELEAGGHFNFQGHTHNHSVLTSVSPAEMEKEFAAVGDWFKQVLNKKPAYFAYPKGVSDKFSEEIVKKYYQLAFAGNGVILPGDKLNLWSIPRITICHNLPLWKFKLLLSPLVCGIFRLLKIF